MFIKSWVGTLEVSSTSEDIHHQERAPGFQPRSLPPKILYKSRASRRRVSVLPPSKSKLRSTKHLVLKNLFPRYFMNLEDRHSTCPNHLHHRENCFWVGSVIRRLLLRPRGITTRAKLYPPVPITWRQMFWKQALYHLQLRYCPLLFLLPKSCLMMSSSVMNPMKRAVKDYGSLIQEKVKATTIWLTWQCCIEERLMCQNETVCSVWQGRGAVMS